MRPTPPAAGVLRVGHAIISPRRPLATLGERLAATAWDMVELDVLRASDGRLVVAHDPGELAGTTEPLGFAAAVAELVARIGPHVRIDVDVKATGYERLVADAITDAGIAPRALVSTMHVASLRALRAHAPDLTLGLSVPRARRDWLGSRWTRPGAYGMLAWLRATLPRRVARSLAAGESDAVMAHWGVVTPRLLSAVHGRGGELFVWTVDDPRRVPALVALGVDGIITNDPAVFTSAPAARIA